MSILGLVKPISASPTLGELIRLQRVSACLTQSQLAELVGVTQSAVAKWESDEAAPALRHRRAIATALSTTVPVLFQAAA